MKNINNMVKTQKSVEQPINGPLRVKIEDNPIKENLVLKKSKLVLNLLMVHYLN